MKKPPEMLSHVSAYLDGELGESEAETIRVKILEDDNWRSLLEEFRELNRILTLWDYLDTRNIRASTDFEQRLFNRLCRLKIKKNLRGKSSSTRASC